MIVVVFGVSASGKSTLGKALADALAWPFVEGDDFHPDSNRALMAAGVALGDEVRAPWLDALARSIAARVSVGASTVYACSALKRRYRAALLTRGVSSRDIRFVYLAAPHAVLEQRLARRRGHFFPGSLLASQLSDLEPPGSEEPAATLTVDATRPIAELVGEIVERLGLAPRSGAAAPG